MDNYSEEFNGSGDSFGAEQLKKRHLPGSDSPEEIRKAVEQCLLSSSSTLDVSRKNIQHLTGEIYTVPTIKYFHLERNVISTIPEDLFQKLPHLVWLDLRYNKIKALPPEIGSHRQLKTLLLEKNPIKELPTELGNLTSLTALNLRDCPLEFPPKDVIQKGLKSILCFLRDSGKGKLPCLEPATSGPSLVRTRGLLDTKDVSDSIPWMSNPKHPTNHIASSETIRSMVGRGDIPSAAERPLQGQEATEMPPVEKLNLSELLPSSLDVSGEWPNEEEKLRFQKLKEEIIKAEKEEFPTDGTCRCNPRFY